MSPSPFSEKPRDKVALASIFFCTIVVAVLAASVRAVANQRDMDLIGGAACGGLVLGVIVTTIFSFIRRPSPAGIFFNILAGVVIGPVAVVLLVAPESLIALATGSLVLIAYAVSVRRLSHHPRPIETRSVSEDIQSQPEA